MSEILRPDEVQALTVRVTTERLCRDYLTLWDRHNDLRYRLLEHGERIAELEKKLAPEPDDKSLRHD